MHKEWIDHRSPERFYKSLRTIAESGVLRARYTEVTSIATFSAFLVLWNAIAGGYVGFNMVSHGPLIPYLPVLSVPLSFFSLTGSSLGLLLVRRAPRLKLHVHLTLPPRLHSLTTRCLSHAAASSQPRPLV